jgi:hypothetical protein
MVARAVVSAWTTFLLVRRSRGCGAGIGSMAVASARGCGSMIAVRSVGRGLARRGMRRKGRPQGPDRRREMLVVAVVGAARVGGAPDEEEREAAPARGRCPVRSTSGRRQKTTTLVAVVGGLALREALCARGGQAAWIRMRRARSPGGRARWRRGGIDTPRRGAARAGRGRHRGGRARSTMKSSRAASGG